MQSHSLNIILCFTSCFCLSGVCLLSFRVLVCLFNGQPRQNVDVKFPKVTFPHKVRGVKTQKGYDPSAFYVSILDPILLYILLNIFTWTYAPLWTEAPLKNIMTNI